MPSWKFHKDFIAETQKFDNSEAALEGNELEKLILLYLDVAQVANHELSGILSQLVWPSLTSLADPSKAYFSESLDESRQDLKHKLNKVYIIPR